MKPDKHTIWVGSPTDVRQGDKAEEALAKQNDTKYWNEETGITEVDIDRWRAAQEYEAKTWLEIYPGARSDRNREHKTGFNNYADLPKNLGSIIEIGCGPFTQLQTILKGRKARRVTLLDPLLDHYKTLSHCPYRADDFLGHDTTTLAERAEDLTATNEFDTAVCINVLEHTQHVGLVLHNLHRCLVTGGIVVFGERCYDKLDINKVYDIGHPIRVKLKVLQEWQEQFEPLYHALPTTKDPLRQDHYYIGKKK
jgi:SAM-dependent methyltransferase